MTEEEKKQNTLDNFRNHLYQLELTAREVEGLMGLDARATIALMTLNDSFGLSFHEIADLIQQGNEAILARYDQLRSAAVSKEDE